MLLLIIAEAIQQAMIDGDNSMTNAFLLILTLLGTDLLMQELSARSNAVDKWLNDVPLVIVEDGKPLQDRMQKTRVNESDVLAEARLRMGLERLDQIKYAVLERNGGISIIPKEQQR